MMKAKHDNDITDCTVVAYVNNDIELLVLVELVLSVTKTRQENDVINRTSVVYIENEIESSWLVEPGVVYDENQTGQRYDWSYRYDLRPKWY